VLTLSNLVLAAGLATLGLAQGILGLGVAWFLLGIGMTMGLYDAAFAALTRLYGREARAAITGITLLAGFASTIGWPRLGLVRARLRLARSLPDLGRRQSLHRNAAELAADPARAAAARLRRRDGRDRACCAAAWRNADPRLLFLHDRLRDRARCRRICCGFSRLPGHPQPPRLSPATLVGPAQVMARLFEFGADGAPSTRCGRRGLPR